MVPWYLLKRLVRNAFALLVFSLTIGCNESSDGQISSASNNKKKINKTFNVRGVVRKILVKENKVHIEHEEIPNYMIAMTMPFSVKNKEELDISSNSLFEKIKTNKLKPIIFKVFNLRDANKAHKELESRKTLGSIILKP